MLAKPIVSPYLVYPSLSDSGVRFLLLSNQLAQNVLELPGGVAQGIDSPIRASVSDLLGKLQSSRLEFGDVWVTGLLFILAFCVMLAVVLMLISRICEAITAIRTTAWWCGGALTPPRTESR